MTELAIRAALAEAKSRPARRVRVVNPASERRAPAAWPEIAAAARRLGLESSSG